MVNIPGTKTYVSPGVWGPAHGGPKWTPTQLLYLYMLKWGNYDVSCCRRTNNVVRVSLYDSELDVFEEVHLIPNERINPG